MCCWNTNLLDYMNSACWSFLICTVISFGAFVVSVLGLRGLITPPGYECYYAMTLSSIISFWMAPPKLKTNTEMVASNIKYMNKHRAAKYKKYKDHYKDNHSPALLEVHHEA